MMAARQAGFEVVQCSYYTVCMFIPFAALVVWDRILGRKPDIKQDVPMIPGWLNNILLRVLIMEQWLMQWVNFPVGVSLFCLLHKV